MVECVETYSTLALYSALIVYALAFSFYAVDLANRASGVPVQTGASRLPVGRMSTARSSIFDAAGKNGGVARFGAGSRALKTGFALTALGFLLHLAATVLRGVAAERVPWANMYEFALTATCAIVLIFLGVHFFIDLRFLGALIMGITLLFLGLTRVNFYVEIVPLPAALNSGWLIVHILVAVLAVGFLTLSFGLSCLQLLQTSRELKPGVDGRQRLRFLASFPDAVRLENLAYRMAIIGFVFWSFTVVAGAIWAESAWSRFWGWDTKEVWSFFIWVLYAGFIHARATRGWRGTRSAWLSVIAYSAVIFNFTIVNLYFKGMHAYSGL